MAFDPTNRKSIRQAEKAARFAERERADVVKALMQHKSGRFFMHEKLTDANIFATSFNTNALVMAFNEGRRNSGLQLLNDLMKFCPDQYILMMREANERDAASSRQHDGGEDGDRDTGGPEFSNDPNFDRGRWVGQGPDPRQPGN